MSKKLNKTAAVDYSILPKEIIKDVKVFENHLDFIGLSADGHPCVRLSNGNLELLLSFDQENKRYNYYHKNETLAKASKTITMATDIPFDREGIKELLNTLKDIQ